MSEVEELWRRFVAALTRTRLPNAGTKTELATLTLTEPRIVKMLADLADRYGWRVQPGTEQLTHGAAEDMLWLWCVHSLWADPSCADLLATACRPGWSQLTNGARFSQWQRYGGWWDGRRPHTGGRADLTCYLGPSTKPHHAFFCELAFSVGTPRDAHKDYQKISRARTALPVWHALIEGSLSTTASERPAEFSLRPGHRGANVIVGREQ
jgi:hypothetical protein